jgi:predicted O-methyltransferase YrrM
VAPGLPVGVRYELRDPGGYRDLSEYVDGSLDLVVVDGILRDECVQAAVPKLRPGGWLYLDNTDKDMTIENGSMRRAEAALRSAVRERDGSLEQHTGLTVALFSTHQWMLASL